MALDMNVTSSTSGVAKSLAKAAKAGAGNPASSFADSLGSLIDGVEDTQAEANSAVSGMLDKTSEVHDAMIALQRAEMTLQLTVQIRNKLVQAYQDVMRMPI
jgi:flagellar hook-basal body complex protein FliE